ncbi:MAG: RraA family protein [Anaerolineae bacterium]|nr:RraA family protein [Anaerolineae bacterium]
MTKNANLPESPLTPIQLKELQQFDAPTISNALELLDFRDQDRNDGIMSSRIKAQFPNMPPMIGYAATLIFETRQPARGKLHIQREDYWRYVLTVPAPRVTVGQDIDPAPAAGSLWGEVQASVHHALGCAGVVLEGGIRDLPPLEAMGYPAFAREVVVGHSWAHIIDYGLPVEAGDVTVRSGDLIFGDRHGVLVIPHAAAPKLADACRKIIDMERPLIAICQDQEYFTLDRLIEAYEAFSKAYPEAKIRK